MITEYRKIVFGLSSVNVGWRGRQDLSAWEGAPQLNTTFSDTLYNAMERLLQSPTPAGRNNCAQ